MLSLMTPKSMPLPSTPGKRVRCWATPLAASHSLEKAPAAWVSGRRWARAGVAGDALVPVPASPDRVWAALAQAVPTSAATRLNRS